MTPGRFRLLFIRFCKAINEKKVSSEFAKFDYQNHEVSLGVDYKEGHGSTVYIKAMKEKIPLCGFFEGTEDYRLNVPAFHNMFPCLMALEDETQIFSSLVKKS